KLGHDNFYCHFTFSLQKILLFLSQLWAALTQATDYIIYLSTLGFKDDRITYVTAHFFTLD
ncbi:MAG: hypothetical protein Q4E30_05445, partial [Streptococcus gallolyticus]|nr:hypothetical protein [Streptococcus gallolyticus]